MVIRFFLGLITGVVLGIWAKNAVVGVVIFGAFLFWPLIRKFRVELLITFSLTTLMVMKLATPTMSPLWGLLFFPALHLQIGDLMPILGRIQGFRRLYRVLKAVLGEGETATRRFRWGVTLGGTFVPPWGLYMQGRLPEMAILTAVMAGAVAFKAEPVGLYSAAVAYSAFLWLWGPVGEWLGSLAGGTVKQAPLVFAVVFFPPLAIAMKKKGWDWQILLNIVPFFVPGGIVGYILALIHAIWHCYFR